MLCIATVVLTMVERRVFTQPWCSITSTLSGCAVAILLLAWAWGLLCFRKASLAVGCLTSSFVFGAVVFVAVLYLPTAAAITVCALLPPLSAALFRVACRKPNHDECPLTQPAQTPLTAHCSEAGGTSWGALIRTFICIGLLGLVESFMRALFLTVDPASSPVAYRWLFLLATVLIIYYKQISEGYEDQARFSIMRKVGMTDRGIRRSVNSQMLTVFFLPLVAAALDTARRAGLCVTENDLMTPRKSVTALLGLSDHPVKGRLAGCGHCVLNTRCEYRKRGKTCASE